MTYKWDHHDHDKKKGDTTDIKNRVYGENDKKIIT